MVFANTVPNTSSNPKTFLGPTARVSVTKPVGDSSAFSILGEAGLKNFRLNGTMGWRIDDRQRLKASAELLMQKIIYSFFDGREDRWVDQGALGADYQYLFQNNFSFNTSFDLAAYVSHAPSQGLGISSGSYVSDAGVLTSYSVKKHIAGSNAFGLSPGILVDTSEGTRFGLALNYDNVRYDTLYRPNTDAKGFGGTVFIKQAIIDDVDLGLTAAVRQPFNNYQADLSWGNLHYYGDWTLSLFGAYTIGKHSLPTTYNAGFAINYTMESDNSSPVFPEAEDENYDKDQVEFKDQPLSSYPEEWKSRIEAERDLTSWVSVPAVYLPQVLAIADEQNTMTLCTPPSFTGAIADLEGAGQTITLTNHFAGSNLSYVLNLLGQDPSGVSLAGTIVSFTNTVSYTNISVTASNACGSATSNTFNFTVD